MLCHGTNCGSATMEDGWDDMPPELRTELIRHTGPDTPEITARCARRNTF